MFFKKNKLKMAIATLIFCAILSPFNANSESGASLIANPFSTNIEFQNVCLIDYKTDSLHCTLYFKNSSEYFMFTVDMTKKDITPVRFFEMKNRLSSRHPNPLAISKRNNQKTDIIFNKKINNKSNFTLLVRYDEIEFKFYIVDTGLIQGTAKLYITTNSNGTKKKTEEEIIIKVLPGDFSQEQ